MFILNKQYLLLDLCLTPTFYTWEQEEAIK